METRKVTLGSRTGLHARPAAALAIFAKELPCRIWIEKGGKRVPADSVLQVLTLGAREGSCLTLSADGEYAAESLERTARFLDALEEA